MSFISRLLRGVFYLFQLQLIPIPLSLVLFFIPRLFEPESTRVLVPVSCLVPAWSRGLRRAFGSWLSQCRDLLLEPFPMFLVLSVL